MGGIGIVGTGISGLQLALYLQSAGVDTTIYSPRSAAEHRTGKLPNCVVRWGPTIERERQLGVFHWEKNNAMEALCLRVADDPPLAPPPPHHGRPVPGRRLVGPRRHRFHGGAGRRRDLPDPVPFLRWADHR